MPAHTKHVKSHLNAQAHVRTQAALPTEHGHVGLVYQCRDGPKLELFWQPDPEIYA